MKRVAILLLALLMSIVLMACGSNSSSKEANENNIKVVYIDWDGMNTKHLTAAKEEFEADNPGVTIELSPQVGNTADYNTKTALMLQSDDSIDIMFLDSFQVPSLVSSGYLHELPVTEWEDWSTQYSDNVKLGVTVKDGVYAIPISTDTRGLYYHIDVFNEVGIPVPWEPKSWDDIMEAIEILHNNDIAYPLWMFASAAQGESTSIQTIQMFLSGTGDPLIENDQWLGNSKGLYDTLEFIENLSASGIYSNSQLSEMLDTNAWQTGVSKFPETGEIGIYLDGNWRGSDWKAVFGDEVTERIGVTPMPKQNGDGFTTMSGGWTFAVSEKSTNPDLAFEFMKVLNNRDNALIYANEIGSMTPRNDTMELTEYKEVNPYRYEMSSYLEFTNYRPGNDFYTSVSTELQVAIESVITGQRTAREALDIYSQNVKSIVGSGNYVEK